MVTYFKDKKFLSKKKKIEIYKTLTPIFESVDTVVKIIATMICLTLFLTGFCLLVVVTIFAGIAKALKLSHKKLHKIFLNRSNRYTKQFEKDQQTVKPFDKFFRKILQLKLNVKKEYENLCKSFTEKVDEINKIWYYFKNTVLLVWRKERINRNSSNLEKRTRTDRFIKKRTVLIIKTRTLLFIETRSVLHASSGDSKRRVNNKWTLKKLYSM